jgi:hypothetical protein
MQLVKLAVPIIILQVALDFVSCLLKNKNFRLVLMWRMRKTPRYPSIFRLETGWQTK